MNCKHDRKADKIMTHGKKSKAKIYCGDCEKPLLRLRASELKKRLDDKKRKRHSRH